ncbi:MAG: chemotaxis protein CheR [bacterium]|nr:chemotaxis protein CheR [bacterium]
MTLNFDIISNLSRQRISDSDFVRLSQLIQTQYGIKMPPCKRQMLESRLRKRLRELGLSNFKDYCKYLFTDEGMDHELVHMLDVVTTNKTDFFREAEHFLYLVNHVLPDMISVHGGGINRDLMLWSAGCSTGEEAYTLSMVLSEFQQRVPGLELRFTILGTDLSTRVLDAAARAVYPEEKAQPIPQDLKRKYLMRSKKAANRLVRVVPELRNRVKFRRLNFLEGDFGMREPIDIVFFRNVMIYFKRETQHMILNKIAHCIRPGGYLFIGHSETLSGLGLPMNQVKPTIYRKPL